MAILYFPNRAVRGSLNQKERDITRSKKITQSGSQFVGSSPLNVLISSNSLSWLVSSVAFTFSNSTSRTYTFGIQNGRQVVSNLNDYLWFHVDTTSPQRIILNPGFYTGTQLAAELQSQLNANTTYVAAGFTFTVVYDNSAGTFTITPSSGTIRYFNVNPQQVLTIRDSIAGHLFGLHVTTAFGANIVSDTLVGGLDAQANIINDTDTLLNRYHDDIHELSIDQAVNVTSNSSNVVIDYAITYEEIL